MIEGIMSTPSGEQSGPIFVGVGAWHSPKHTRAYRDELGKLGLTNFYAPDLPVDVVGATFDDDTNVLCDSMNGHERIKLILHSRSGALLPRILNHPSISAEQFEYIWIVNSAGPEKFQLQGEANDWPRHTPGFQAGLPNEPTNGLTEYDPAIARRIFFNRAEDQQVVREAVDDLRPHRVDQPGAASPLPQIPPKEQRPPIYWSFGDFDLVHNRRREGRMAMELYGIVMGSFAGSHTPFVAQPEAFAKLTAQMSGKFQSNAEQN